MFPAKSTDKNAIAIARRFQKKKRASALGWKTATSGSSASECSREHYVSLPKVHFEVSIDGDPRMDGLSWNIRK